MDSCLTVEREIDKVLTKFGGLNDHSVDTLEDFINSIENLRKELAAGPADGEVQVTQSLVMTQALHRVQEATSRMGQEHKDLHSTVSKVGKTIDRNFVSEFSAVFTESSFENEETQLLLNEIICEHFLRQGKLDIAEALNEEADLNLDPSQMEPFLELHRILGALKRRNLQPALSWTAANRDSLQNQGSNLEFKLHRLQFIELVSLNPQNQTQALEYAKHFARFADKHAREVQVLMGSLLYMKQGIHTSPYAFLLDPIYWDEICDVFTRDACALMGMSVESPLSVSIRAGCRALPPLLNIRQVMQQRQVSGVWTSKDELPVEIDLGNEHRYHSIFACPILRQQSTEHNPPVRLICGHVISRDALHKLASGNKYVSQFGVKQLVKCPYCPVEQNPDDAKIVIF
ncbi:E3 ubiquitin-protein ligase RMND5A-like isoform X1 [Mercenaria mercenaria]|uniref:E3 ubiquitin-protein ligase RMND5A-like isoform X1 n=1 Tax=Mercenaria mercenaria TaxID=6596 RepID=UPI00234F17E8|nr:E3 ubiquitin-protein ligase RMND5A-like isoform X1 [Mercenaria mercenaria]